MWLVAMPEATAYTNWQALLASQWTTTAACSWWIASTIESCVAQQVARREALWVMAMAVATAYTNWK